MNKVTLWLSFALIAQLMLAGILLMSARGDGEFSQRNPLLSVNQDQVTRIVVADTEGEVTIARVGEKWILPDVNALPGNSAKVSELLNKLGQITAGWPVATSGAAQARFDVAGDKFQRRVQLFDGDGKETTLFLGTSPAFRSVHARIDGNDKIFSVALATHDFPMEYIDWIDKGLLKLDAVTRIEGSDFSFVRESDEWALINSAISDVADFDDGKVDAIGRFFEQLSVQGLAEPLTEAEPSIVLYASDNDKRWTYSFVEDNGQYYVFRDDRRQWFELSSFDFDKVSGLNLEYFTMDEAAGSSPDNDLDSEATAEDSLF